MGQQNRNLCGKNPCQSTENSYFDEKAGNMIIGKLRLSWFVRFVRPGSSPENTGVQGAERTVAAILGSMAVTLRREVTWDEMMRSGDGCDKA